MATVNKACSANIALVNSSGLDFSLNLKPYSIHFSIRGKFSDNSSTRNDSSLLKISSNSQNDHLQQELQQLRSDYDKLKDVYMAETKEKTRLQNELIKVTKKHETEMFKIKDSLNTKGIELKQLKGHLEDVKKDKNALSVALKGKLINL